VAKQEHPRDADHAVLALALFLVLARDHFVAPGHRLADVAEAELREFAQDLLNNGTIPIQVFNPLQGQGPTLVSRVDCVMPQRRAH
jgi:hypothetical protein